MNDVSQVGRPTDGFGVLGVGLFAGRPRRWRTSSWVAALVAAAGLGCAATGESLRLDAATIERRLNEVRRAGGYSCAPTSLAQAEAHLEFLRVELARGDAARAAEHRMKSRRAMTRALKNSRDCVLYDRDGDRIPDERDECPDEAEDRDAIEDDDGCPETEDTDGDGVLDEEDSCPRAAEDEDGFQDGDGCPDFDNDRDGLHDTLDGCPFEAETINGFQDEDGCPDGDRRLVEVKRDVGKLEIKQKVYFASGKARVHPRSFRLLEQVADVLRAYPSMSVLIEGHTDSTGSREMNLRISQARANRVRAFLRARGVSGARLAAVGQGEDKPVASNRSPRGRDRNRRVEFTITGE